MEASQQSGRAVRFGAFELDLTAGELRKSGLKVRLQEQPFRLLVLLVERPGEVVTREEVREKLWPSDTYVDFDRSLNTAASKLREALGDSASSPRFIETLPRRGYRFLASVEVVGDAEKPAAAVEPESPLGDQDQTSREARTRKQLRLAWSVAAILVLALGFTLLQRTAPDASQLPLRRFSIGLPANVGARASMRDVAISPDGRYIAFATGGKGKLWVQDLDQGKRRAIEGTEGAGGPFWSPDSSFIGFGAAGELKKAPVRGGEVSHVCQMPNENFFGGTWSPDGDSIVFSSGLPVEIYEVSARSGIASLLIESVGYEGPSDGPQGWITWPEFLPSRAGPRVVMFTYGPWYEPKLMIQDLDTGRRTLLGGGTRPVYSSSSHIVYQTTYITNDIWALPFSLDTLTPTGEPFLIAQDGSDPTFAADGTLVYLDASEPEQKQLVWFDRHGEETGRVGQPQQSPSYPALSPDERYVSVSAIENENRDIWIWDINRGMKDRLTSSPGVDQNPRWSPTGKEIAFTSNHGKGFDIYLQRTGGRAEEEALAATPGKKEYLCDWSRDGRYLVYETEGSGTGNDLWYLESSEDGSSWEPHPFLETPFDERGAQFSPDGRYLAYVSDESGQYEIYVRPFPKGEGKWPISSNGGGQPRWNRDGKELFFAQRGTLMAVSVVTGSSFSAGSVTPLFEHDRFLATGVPKYDVSADGQRFLLADPVEDGIEPSVQVVQNWFVKFKDRQNEAP